MSIIYIFFVETGPFEGNLQLLRHAVLVGVLSINAFIVCSFFSPIDKLQNHLIFSVYISSFMVDIRC